jgi:hypothetical protein
MSRIHSGKKTSSPKGKDFWGPPIWRLIHIFAITISPERKEAYKEFLWLLTKLLPCDYCKSNLIQKLKEHPPEKFLSDSNKAFWYSYMIHDLANQNISKHNPRSPKFSPIFDEVRNFYIKNLKTQGDIFCGNAVWTVIHILAVTLKPENAIEYKRVLELLTILLPYKEWRKSLRGFLEHTHITYYLRNNHDTFLYSYMLHKTINQKIGKDSPTYEIVKNFYFSSLGEECDSCTV